MNRYRMPIILIALIMVSFAPLVAFGATSTSFFGPIIPPECNCPSKGSIAGGGLQTGYASWGCVIKVVQNLVTFGVSIGIIIAVLIIAYAGFLWVINPVSPENRSKARQILINAAIGLVLTLAAWLLVNTLLNVLGAGSIGSKTSLLTITIPGEENGCAFGNADKGNELQQQQPGGLTTGGSGCPSGQTCQVSNKCGPPQNACGSNSCTGSQVCSADGKCVEPQACTYHSVTQVVGNEKGVRDQLSAAGISINKNPCPDGVRYEDVPGGCTSVGGLREATVSQVITIKGICGSVEVTGGSELGHADGGQSHSSGSKVDLATNIDSCIEGGSGGYFSRSGSRGSDARYVDKCGNEYVRETSSPHWDITVTTACPR